MKEEGSHPRRLPKLSERLEKEEEDRRCGEVFTREKEDDYLWNFCETEALASSTCLDIVLTTMPTPKAIMIRFMSCTDLDLRIASSTFCACSSK